MKAAISRPAGCATKTMAAGSTSIRNTDVEELSKEITKGMEIVYIKEMNEVIREAFVPEK